MLIASPMGILHHHLPHQEPRRRLGRISIRSHELCKYLLTSIHSLLIRNLRIYIMRDRSYADYFESLLEGMPNTGIVARPLPYGKKGLSMANLQIIKSLDRYSRMLITSPTDNFDTL